MGFRAWREVDLLISSVPVVEIPDTSTEIGGITQPSQVWSQSPASNLVDLAPDVGQVSDGTGKCNDVNSGFNWALGDEEERHPEEVETELDSVESRAVLGRLDIVGRLQRREAGAVGAIGGVAHEAVHGNPGWAKGLRWNPVGWLLKSQIGLLSLFGLACETNGRAEGDRKEDRSRRVCEHRGRQREAWDVGSHDGDLTRGQVSAVQQNDNDKPHEKLE